MLFSRTVCVFVCVCASDGKSIPAPNTGSSEWTYIITDNGRHHHYLHYQAIQKIHVHTLIYISAVTQKLTKRNRRYHII